MIVYIWQPENSSHNSVVHVIRFQKSLIIYFFNQCLFVHLIYIYIYIYIFFF